MMVVMLILTIILAAFAPLMTKRKTVDLSNPWRYTANNSDIYYGLASAQTAMIGQNSKSGSDPNSRLIINTANDNQKHLLFKQGANILGAFSYENDNLRIGSIADDFSGTGNLAVGKDVLSTKGSYNIVVGINSFHVNGQNNNTDNVVVGRNVMAESMTSSVPASSGSSYNVVVGNEAMKQHTRGTYNTVMGYQAMSSDTDGFYNTAIGYRVMGGNKTGSSNTAVGMDALWNNVDGRLNSALGYKACENVKGSNKTCIGAYSGPSYSAIANNESEAIFLGTSDAMVFIDGQLYLRGISMQTSDKRLKNIKSEFTDGIAAIRKLKPYNFTFKYDERKTPRVGVIAQDLQKVFPHAVSKGDDGYLAIRKEDIFYAMINAIKQLDILVQDVIADLKNALCKISKHDNEIKALQKENKKLKEQNIMLEKRIQALESKF